MSAVPRVVVIGAVLVALGALGLAALREGGPRILDDRVHAVASTLRCPVCLNLSAADSPSPVAQEMRATIRRELEEGKTPDQIRAEFVAAYGEWILLSPAAHGLNLLAWIVPAGVLLGGLLVVVLALRRWTPRAAQPAEPSSRGRAATGEGLSDEDRNLLQQAMTGVSEQGE